MCFQIKDKVSKVSVCMITLILKSTVLASFSYLRYFMLEFEFCTGVLKQSGSLARKWLHFY